MSIEVKIPELTFHEKADRINLNILQLAIRDLRQELSEELAEKEERIKTLEAEVISLDARVTALEP